MCVVLFPISHFSYACSLDYIVILFSFLKIILSSCFFQYELGVKLAMEGHANF